MLEFGLLPLEGQLPIEGLPLEGQLVKSFKIEYMIFYENVNAIKKSRKIDIITYFAQIFLKHCIFILRQPNLLIN